MFMTHRAVERVWAVLMEVFIGRWKCITA